VEIKDSQFKAEPLKTFSNRIVVKVDGSLALAGHKRETRIPLYLAYADLSLPKDMRELPDCSFQCKPSMFLKRKFITTSNAKNFFCGSLRDQTEYFDELQDKVIFSGDVPLRAAVEQPCWKKP
jgi:hypothetical protein